MLQACKALLQIILELSTDVLSPLQADNEMNAACNGMFNLFILRTNNAGNKS
jgi:hypothetical protein